MLCTITATNPFTTRCSNSDCGRASVDLRDRSKAGHINRRGRHRGEVVRLGDNRTVRISICHRKRKGKITGSCGREDDQGAEAGRICGIRAYRSIGGVRGRPYDIGRHKDYG